MNLQQVDSIIFDLDGTLWDATDSYVASWNLALQQFGIEKTITRPDLESMMGWEEKAVFEKMFPHYSLDHRRQIAQLVSQNQDAYIPVHGGVLYENVREGLIDLSQKYRLLVVSNCPENTVRDFLSWSGLENYFIDYETHGRTRQSKAENIKAVVQRNNLQSPVYVGDTESDSKAAQLAHVPFVFVSYGFGKVENAAYSFNSFPELVKAFTTLPKAKLPN
ncbi:HAD family hydrolase [Adhaeribacter radiodurans]|uniref:phosphoglycolate phosphatase n=1 Tax=Adhaeribacter radiodurans TaxID=2745197 RepID=A0A7L7L5M7_9BACT|nr:HAD family hydrolase [Adhaeribacter radiodurans]QMU27905.1 HAD family hydrolase [Adhaeribacter radiodurans]